MAEFERPSTPEAIQRSYVMAFQNHGIPAPRQRISDENVRWAALRTPAGMEAVFDIVEVGTPTASEAPGRRFNINREGRRRRRQRRHRHHHRQQRHRPRF